MEVAAKVGNHDVGLKACVCACVSVTHFKHLQRKVEKARQRCVEVGLPRGGANTVRRRQQQQEGDAVS